MRPKKFIFRSNFYSKYLDIIKNLVIIACITLADNLKLQQNMTKKLISYTILGALFALPGLAFSGDFKNPVPTLRSNSDPTGYVFGYGGYAFGETVSGYEPLFPSNENIEFDDGFIVGGGMGVYSKFLNGSRFEFEGLITKTDISRITSDIFDGNGFVDFGIRGQKRTNAVMVNLLKEIPLAGLTAYIGGGVGFSDNTLTLNFGGPVPPAPPVPYGSPESATALAYQFIAGVDVPIAERVDLFLQYKLLGVDNTSYEHLDLEVDSYFTHNIVFGARLSF